jgi:uncharacterized repeat protein (TIGR01451 family)
VRTLRLDVRAGRPGRWATVVRATGLGVPEARAQGIVQVMHPAMVLKLDGPRQGSLHQEQTFQLTVSNPAPQAAERVRLTQGIPDGLEYVEGSTGGTYNPTTHELRWTLDRLEPGQHQMVTFRTRARQVGDWALPAALGADGMAEAYVRQAIHIDTAPMLNLELTALDDPLDPGGETNYEVRIYNPGPAPGSDLQLTLVAPAIVLPTSASGPTRVLLQGGKVMFESLPQLPPQTDTVFRVRLRGLQPGQGQFRAILNARALLQPLTQEITTHVRGGTGGPADPPHP